MFSNLLNCTVHNTATYIHKDEIMVERNIRNIIKQQKGFRLVQFNSVGLLSTPGSYELVTHTRELRGKNNNKNREV